MTAAHARMSDLCHPIRVMKPNFFHPMSPPYHASCFSRSAQPRARQIMSE
jgi:hypothetical protein